MLRLADCRFETGVLLDVQVAPDMRSLILILEAEIPDGPQGDLERMRRTLIQVVAEGVGQLTVQRRPELPHTMDDPGELPPSPVFRLAVADVLDEWDRPCYELALQSKFWRIQAVAHNVVALPLDDEGADEDEDEEPIIS